MKNIFEVGHTMSLVHTVEQADLATFETGNVHPFYSTFALGRDAEWACRQFVLQMKEADEEGIGTFLNIRHKSPAMLGDSVEFIATVSLLEGHQIDCSFVAKVGERIVAEGEQGQKILKKEKLDRLVNQIING
jgi:fluoroacetyl-CoA thioesterase